MKLKEQKIKILHSADWHANYNFEKFLSSYRQIFEYIKNNKIDLMVISGDIFDSRMFADKNYNRILELVANITEYCPILTIYGTPSHDYRGSLDGLKHMGKKYPIHIVEKIEDKFFLFRDKQLTKHDISEEVTVQDSVIISCLPWPMKYRLLTDNEMKLSLKEQETIYSEKLENWLQKVKSLKRYGVPTFLVSHLQLNGSIMLKDQDVSSDNHDPKDYYKVADYSLLGHIHKHQNIKNLYYSGSIYNKTWNELEDKYFNVWTIQDGKITIEERKINTPKKIKIECTLEEYRNLKKSETSEVRRLLKLGNSYELWFVITLPIKEQLDSEKEEGWWNWYEDGIDIHCRIDLITIKMEISERAKNFDTKTSLTEKFINWCKFKELEPTDFQINKIKELEEK